VRRVVFLLSVLAIVAGSPGCRSEPLPEGQVHRLDAAAVPESLRGLVPLAERWGIGDDVERGRAIEQATEAEKEQLREAVDEHGAEITRWLDSFDRGEPMTDEAAAFMYMQLAVEEMPE
jgi:hypothetical protein